MDSVFEQYLMKIIELIESQASVATAANRELDVGTHSMTPRTAPITNPSQVVIPVIAWDWPPAMPGTITSEQFRFADMIPLSTQSKTEYAPSSDSFSSNYRAFLDLIDDKKFPWPSLLGSAKAKISVPSGNPPDSPSPPGWTKVLTAGIQRWAPIWELSESAYDWKSKVTSGAISNPGSIVLDLRTGGANTNVLQQKIFGTETLQPLAGSAKAFETIKISAAAWGQVAVYPGSWFDSSMFKFGKKFVVNPTSFFGPSGLLRGRVSAFIVAYEVKFELTAAVPVGASFASTIARGKNLYAFGLPVELPPSGPIPSGQETSVHLSSMSQEPSIVAVIIESYGGQHQPLHTTTS